MHMLTQSGPNFNRMKPLTFVTTHFKDTNALVDSELLEKDSMVFSLDHLMESEHSLKT